MSTVIVDLYVCGHILPQSNLSDHELLFYKNSPTRFYLPLTHNQNNLHHLPPLQYRIRQRNIAARLVLRNIDAVLILDPQHHPQRAPKDLDDGDDVRHGARVLDVVGKDNVQDPGHAHDGVGDHDGVVDALLLEREDVAEVVFGFLLREAKVHVDVPECWGELAMAVDREGGDVHEKTVASVEKRIKMVREISVPSMR